MSTTRDLLEAQSWARRRLIAAHLGQPPRGQLRATVAGLVLAACVVAAPLVERLL